jgi:phage host-nuclease inhibitor protein Gam
MEEEALWKRRSAIKEKRRGLEQQHRYELEVLNRESEVNRGHLQQQHRREVEALNGELKQKWRRLQQQHRRKLESLDEEMARTFQDKISLETEKPQSRIRYIGDLQDESWELKSKINHELRVLKQRAVKRAVMAKRPRILEGEVGRSQQKRIRR